MNISGKLTHIAYPRIIYFPFRRKKSYQDLLNFEP
jgi:hypothetical protein